MSEKRHGNFRDVSGHQFETYTVIKPLQTGKQGTRWICKCDCGHIWDMLIGNIGRTGCPQCAVKKYSGSKHPLWKGGNRKHSSGYNRVLCKDHPNADSTGYVYQHRLIVESVLGRYLSSDELVHHIDGDTSNNNHCNLLLCDKSFHQRLHTQMKKKIIGCSTIDCEKYNDNKCSVYPHSGMVQKNRLGYCNIVDKYFDKEKQEEYARSKIPKGRRRIGQQKTRRH